MDYWLMINAIIIFIIAFALCCVPLVIKIAIKKRLLGEYGEGRRHKGVPGLVGWLSLLVSFYLKSIL